MNILSTPLGFLEYWGIYRAKRRSGGTEVGTTYQGTLGPPGAPWWVVLSSEHPQAQPGPIMFLLVQKKISVKFRCVWTPFGIDFLRCKKHAENSNWHLALCQ